MNQSAITLQFARGGSTRISAVFERQELFDCPARRVKVIALQLHDTHLGEKRL